MTFGSSVVAGLAALTIAGTAYGQDVLGDTILADGKRLFDSEASGIGCVICHGEDATGDAVAGGPNVRGATQAQLSSAIGGAVPVMEIFSLSGQEQAAITAYLNYLALIDGQTLDDTAAQGRAIFDYAAGDVGCRSCHGEDATGGVVGPDIHVEATDPANILDALMTVPEMDFIELNDEELAAVADYMRFMHDLEAH